MRGEGTAVRLREAIRAVIPEVNDISIGVSGDPGTVRVFPSIHQEAANATIAAFDWSSDAEAQWENLQARARARARINESDEFAKLIRAILRVCLQEIKGAVPTYTIPPVAQIKAKVRDVLDGGGVDT